MFVSLILSVACIALSPVLIFFDGTIAQACLTALSAAALATSVYTIRSEQIHNLQPMSSRIAFAALLPAAWMLIQALPLGILGLGHPIWASAGSALGLNLTASISVDPGTTIIVLGRYAGFVALGLAVSIITIDRGYAERILFTLLAISVLTALFSLGRPDLIIESDVLGGAVSSTSTIIGIGCIVCVAATVRAFERSEIKSQGSRPLAFSSSAPGIAIGIVGFFLCALALIRIGQKYALLATVFGLGAFAALALIRRLGFGVWGMAAIGATLIAITFAVFAQTDIIQSSSPLLAFSNPGKDGLTTAERMLADIRWGGSGAGALGELIELYRDVDETTFNAISGFSTVAIVAIDLGRPMLIVIGVGVIVLTIILLQGTIRRGRDSFFPATGAGSLLVLCITSFGDSALLRPAVAIYASVVIGLAIAQSAGRRAHRPT